MTPLDRLLLLAVTAGLAAVVWRVDQLRGEVTDKRIDDTALVLHAWGRDQRDRLHASAGGGWADLAAADAIRRAPFTGGRP